MTTGRFIPRLMSRVLASSLTMGAVAAVVTTPAGARADVEAGACRIHEVLASKTGDGKIPKALEFLRPTLKDDAFAAYRGFHLVDKQTLSFKKGVPKTASFRSGHKLALELVGGDKDRLRIQLELTQRDGKKGLVKTQYTQEDNGLLLVDVGNYTSGEVSGKLLFTFQCARR